MKQIILIFIVICGSSLAHVIVPKINLEQQKQSRGINDEILKAIENLKKQMPCGMPDLGIPVLAPFDKTYTEFVYNNKLVEMAASAIDLRVDGLNVFDVNEIKFNALTLKANFDFNFNEIHARSQYVANAFLLKIIKLSGKGDLDIKLNNLRFKGFAQLGANSNGLYMRDFNITISLGSIKSDTTGLLWGKISGKLANKAMEKFVTVTMKYKHELISEMAREIVIKQANEALEGVTIKDILEIINKPKDPVECVSPKPIFY